MTEAELEKMFLDTNEQSKLLYERRYELRQQMNVVDLEIERKRRELHDIAHRILKLKENTP